jgi:acetate CoA/acetoacetate CoA-transferase beta subunit
VAKELRSGNLVNLGIGIPTLVADYVPEGLKVFFQSENGLIGTGPIPEQGMAHPLLTDAGGKPISALPGAATFDSAMSFGLIRGGHVDITVLGGLQVDAGGHLANWMIPGKMVPGMGGAMDLVSGAKRVIVAMQHAAKGKSKIVAKCNLPLTSSRPVHLVVTDMAVIAFAGGRPISALPGAATFDSAMSFGLIRGGHVDITVLGGLQVDGGGHLANWMIPGKMVPGMGGAMDLVSGAKRVIVAMQHAAKGKSKIVAKCNLPLTSARPVDMVVTDMAVIAFPGGKATLIETAPGLKVAEVLAVAEAELAVPDRVPEMKLS